MLYNLAVLNCSLVLPIHNAVVSSLVMLLEYLPYLVHLTLLLEYLPYLVHLTPLLL